MNGVDVSSLDNLFVSSSQLSSVKSWRGKKVKLPERNETFSLSGITLQAREVFSSSCNTNASKSIEQLNEEIETMKNLISHFKKLDEECGGGYWKKVSRMCARKHRVKDDLAAMGMMRCLQMVRFEKMGESPRKID